MTTRGPPTHVYGGGRHGDADAHPLDAPNTRADLAPLRGGEGRAARDCVGQGSCALEGR